MGDKSNQNGPQNLVLCRVQRVILPCGDIGRLICSAEAFNYSTGRKYQGVSYSKSDALYADKGEGHRGYMGSDTVARVGR